MKQCMLGRRDFIKQAACGLCCAGIAPLSWAYAKGLSPNVPRRALGKTSQLLSSIGLTASSLASIEDRQAAIDLTRNAVGMDGLTLIDMAWESSNEQVEEWIGKALAGGMRDKAFLTTAMIGAGKEACLEQLGQTLKRLQTDRIDLCVFRENHYRQDPSAIFSRNGAIAAATEARNKGQLRYIGFTGYGDSDYFSEMVHRFFEWDAVEVPFNGFDSRYVRFREKIMPLLFTRNIGLIAVNPISSEPHRPDSLAPEAILSLLWSDLFTTIALDIESSQALETYSQYAADFRTLPEKERKALLKQLPGPKTEEGK